MKWNEEEIELLKKYGSEYTDLEMKEKYLFNRSECAIHNQRRKLKITHNEDTLNRIMSEKQKMWTKEEVDFLLKNYENMSYPKISKILNRTLKSVEAKARKLNLSKEKYSYDKDYFQDIDTEDKAYWLGFLYADGYVRYENKIETNKPSNYEFGIQLAIKDKNHLKKFNKSLNGNVEVVEIKQKSPFRENVFYDECKIRFYNKKMVEDLISLNVTPRKTYSKDFPIVRNDLVRHFIRGFFDGDGCIMFHKKRKRYQCDFCSINKDFMEYLRKILFNNNIKSYICLEKENELTTTQCYRLRIGGKENVKIFLDYIYKDSNIYLDRKYKRYELQLQNIPCELYK